MIREIKRNFIAPITFLRKLFPGRDSNFRKNEIFWTKIITLFHFTQTFVKIRIHGLGEFPLRMLMYAKIVRDRLQVITLNLLVVNFYSNAVRSKRKKRSERIRVDGQSRLVPILMQFNMWLARQNGNCNLFVECEILVQLIFNFSVLNASLSLSLSFPNFSIFVFIRLFVESLISRIRWIVVTDIPVESKQGKGKAESWIASRLNLDPSRWPATEGRRLACKVLSGQ